MRLSLLKRDKIPDIRKIIAKVAPLTAKQRQALQDLSDIDVAPFIANHFGITEEQVLRKAATQAGIQFMLSLPTPFLRVFIGHPTLKELRARSIIPIVKNVGEILIVGCNPSDIYKLYPLVANSEIVLATADEIFRVLNEVENNLIKAMSPEQEILQALNSMYDEARRFSTSSITINIYADTLEYTLLSKHGEKAVGTISPELRTNLIDSLSASALCEIPLSILGNSAVVKAISTTSFEVFYQCSLQQAASL